jgi:hypothetical protein
MLWARMLAYITGTVDEELLLRNQYLAAENRILRAQIKGRLLLSDAEKATLAEIAHRLAVFGEIRGGGPVWDVKSGGTACVLVADCQWPQSRACLKPETMRVTLRSSALRTTFLTIGVRSSPIRKCHVVTRV